MARSKRQKEKIQQRQERGDFKIKYTARPIKDGYIGMNKLAYESLFKKKYPYSNNIILVYKAQSGKMKKNTFEHEKIEYALMSKGYSYRYAHQISEKYESKPKQFKIDDYKGKGRKGKKAGKETRERQEAAAVKLKKPKAKQRTEKVTIISGRGMRTRKQVAINYRYKGLEDGESIPLSFVSIRAVTVNPDITENGLKIAVREARERFKRAGFNPSNYNTSIGFEEAKISSSEDKRLNDGKVYIEILENRKSSVYAAD